MTSGGRVVAVEGSSAAGKTTLVRAAAQTFGWEALAEAFDRLDPTPSLTFRSPRELLRLEGTLLAEEARRYRDAMRLRSQGKTVVADTGFLGPLTYTWGLVGLGRAPGSVARSLTRAATRLARARSLGLPDLTVYLETTRSERLRRARFDRGHHPASLFPRHESVGQIERRYYQELLPSEIPRRVRTLRARPSPELLTELFREIVDGGPRSRSTEREALAAVRLLPSLARDARRRKVRPNR